ncbi:MAG: peptidylprolyl isomerase [Pseudomonadota bacterium]|uniref:peptidylprolyl isomerase n=1 Tax=Polaromonas sp. TaxID=1869339 RepID=UPI00184F0FE7|nr:peptidylprolyl isomerase [Polaromonas sp.]MBA3594374.1 peptidylprolyl isomerase [Polaromonas sp.]MDQ3271709.1 peptidylprolyl isomerase [Pseudomonadota bacterium]
MTKYSRLHSPVRRPAVAVVLALSVAMPLMLVQAQTLRVPGQQLRTPGLGVTGSGVAGGAGVQRQADYIVAVVNSEPITNNEVRARILRTEQQMRQQGAQVPPRNELVRLLMERLIVERAQLQLARETGVQVSDAMVDDAVANVARQNQLSTGELRRRLEADGLPFSQFRNDLRDEIVLNRLRDRELDSRAKVSDQEVEQFLRAQAGGGTAPVAMELNLAQILVAVPESATAEQVAALQARAQLVAERARSGTDFAQLVKEFSNAPGGRGDGQMGLRPPDRYPELFVNATQNLPIGGVAGPVRSGAGFHVLKLIEKKRAGMPGATVAETRARHILLRPGPQLNEAAAVARLAEFKTRIAAGQADFAALAREFSQDGSAKDGGDLGWAGAGMFVPEFEERLNSLAPGQVGDPLVSRFGVHLIQVLERRNSTLSPREQREAVRAALRENKLEEAYAAWAQEVRGRAYVEYREPPQ